MATFTDDFQYANGAIETATSSAWLAIGDGTSVDVDILQNAATNADAVAARAIFQTTVAATASQSAAAWVVSTEEGTDAYVDIGVAAAKTPSSFAADVLGIYARLLWNSNGVRTLSIRHKLRNGSDTELASVNLVTAGGVEAPGYEGTLHAAGALDELQHLRLIVTEEDYGLGVRAYVNELATPCSSTSSSGPTTALPRTASRRSCARTRSPWPSWRTGSASATSAAPRVLCGTRRSSSTSTTRSSRS